MARYPRPALSVLVLVCCALHDGSTLAGADQNPATTEASTDAPVSLEDLMRRFAGSGGVRARFRETKHLSLLVVPLETAGVLYFAPPDRLARQTTHPGRSSVVVRGNRAAFRDETGHQIVDLGASDVARHFVDNLGVLLRGDLAALETRYSVGFRSDGREWVLQLEPRSRIVRGIVEWIRVEGRGAQLTEMETRETSGDTTVTIFTEVETGLDFTSTEIERIFALEDPDGAP